MTATSYVRQWAAATYGGTETVNTFTLSSAPLVGNVLVAVMASDAGTVHSVLPGNGTWSREFRQNGTHTVTVLWHVVTAGAPDNDAAYGFTGGVDSDDQPTDGYLLELTGLDLSRGPSLAISSAYDVRGLTVGQVDASSPFQPATQPPDVLAVTLGYLSDNFGSSSAAPITMSSSLDVTLTQRSTGSSSGSQARSALFLREVTDLTADDAVPGARISAAADGAPIGGLPMDDMSVGMLILPLGPVTTAADAAFTIVQDDGVCSFVPARTGGTHLWTFGDGSSTSAATSPTHTYVPGTYTATHQWTDPLGVSATASKTFTARAAGDRLSAMFDVLRLEVSLDSGATWTNVLGTATQVSTHREILGVGTLTATFKGTTYDPGTSPTLDVGNRLRLMALDAGTWKPLWVGRISAARLSGENVQMEGVDNTSVLARTPYQDCVRSFAEIGPALAASGLTYTAPAQTAPFVVASISKGSVLDQLLITRDTVKGHAWVARDGSVKVVSTRSATVAGVLAESAYSQLTVEKNVDQIVNDMTVKFLRYLPTSGACEPVEYGPFRIGASVDVLGSRSAVYTIVGAIEDGGDIETYADSILAVNAYVDVAPASLRLPIRKTGDVSTSRALLDLNDLVQVTNTAKGIARNDMRVAAVNHQITPGRWLVDLELDVDGYVARPIVTTEPTGDTHSHFVEQLYDVYTDNTGSGPSNGSALTYDQGSDLWVANDHGPRGNVGSVLQTANSATLATTASPGTTVLTVNVPVVTGRKYRLTAYVHCQSTVAADRHGLMLYAGTTRVQLGQVYNPIAASTVSHAITGTYTATSTATIAFQVRAYRSSGTGNATLVGASTQPGTLDVDDVGKP